jgi:CHASE2 domain-containing sensor protein
MRRPRKPTPPTTEAIDTFCAAFDDLLGRYEERRAARRKKINITAAVAIVLVAAGLVFLALAWMPVAVPPYAVRCGLGLLLWMARNRWLREHLPRLWFAKRAVS